MIYMRRRKRKINAINGNIAQLTKIIGDKIIEDSSSIESKMSKVNNSLFVENEFKIDTCQHLETCDCLTIHYTMYLADDEIHSNVIVRDVGDSRVDLSSNTIYVVSSFVRTAVAKNFYDTIAYELGILHQYGCGECARDKLIKKVDSILNEYNNGSVKYNVALCIKHIFTNEQNVVVKSFYEHLCSVTDNGNFEHIIGKFYPYVFLNNGCSIIKDGQNNSDVISCVNYFHFSMADFIKLMEYFENRLKIRLINMYTRYNIDNRKINCHYISIFTKIMDDYLYECKKRGHEIEWVYENSYRI